MSMLAKFPTFTSILGKQTSLNSLKVIFFSISTPPGEGVRSGDYRGRRREKERERGGKEREGERKEDMQVRGRKEGDRGR